MDISVNHLPPFTGSMTVPSASRMSTGQKVQPLTFRVSPVGFRGVAVPLVIGVGLDDGGPRQVFLDQVFHPIPGDDVGAVQHAI